MGFKLVCGECSCNRLYLVPNSHLWFREFWFVPAATPRATVTTGWLSQMWVSGVVCASTPNMCNSRTSILPLAKSPMVGATATPSNWPEWRTALVARELARYKVDVAALRETRFSEQSQLEELGADNTLLL
ncbi:unnamed protein product [Schistocephalus solidus]|uniref:Uncharacterized protein n=1 Tax=Schistocephalus solidus TaxID=70667 RepID=A0A183S854_SCHSO|nr:unnamed protein product [Schistocephalus solidus]